MIKFKNEAAITSPLAVFYSSALMITLKIFYIYYVFPSEAYRGYIYNNHGYLFEIFSLIIGLVPLSIISKRLNKPADYTLSILFVFIYIPSISIGAYILDNQIQSISFYFTNIVGILCLILSINFFSKYFLFNKLIRLPNQLDYQIFITFVCILLGYCFISIIQNISYLSSIQSMSDIYELRLNNRGNSGDISGYLYAILRSLIIILFVYLFFETKKKLIKFLYFSIIILICMDQLVSLFIRSHFYVLIILVGIGYLFKNNLHNFYYIPATALIISLTFFTVDYIFRIEFLSYTFVRRLLVVPGVIGAFYFEYVNEIGTFFELEYASRFFNFDEVTYTIGAYSDPGNFEINMNSHFWSISYAYLGVIGIIITSIVSGLILSILNNVKRNPFLAVLFCVYFGLIWSEQSLWSSMLSNGIIFCVLFYLMYTLSSSTKWNRL